MLTTFTIVLVALGTMFNFDTPIFYMSVLSFYVVMSLYFSLRVLDTKIKFNMNIFEEKNRNLFYNITYINILVGVMIIYFTLKMFSSNGNENIINVAVLLVVDLFLRFAFIKSDAKKDYRIFSGVSGKEDKKIIREQLLGSIYGNSIGTFLTILVFVIPLLTETNSIAYTIVSIIFYVISLIILT